MENKVLLSTAYFPPITYMSVLAKNKEVTIETQENFQKQTYRNRTKILSANGPMNLVVPVIKGRSAKKTLITEIKIDYTTDWQTNHIRSIKAAYASSPFFDFYFDQIENVIMHKHIYLFDLNFDILHTVMNITGLNTEIRKSTLFEAPGCCPGDYRNVISPKNKQEPINNKPYIQVFEDKFGFTPSLSVLDLIFNLGPESAAYLKSLEI